MGLDTTHDAWHGAYSAFMRWRTEIAKAAGMPPLELMEGFFQPMKGSQGIATFYLGRGADDELARSSIERLEQRLPIKWECLKPSPLHELLFHSDCDGEIPTESCGPIADELEKLLPLLPGGEGGGHIGNWRDKTKQFIDGLRAAAAAGEPLGFH
jgi:hypothetical protein